MDNDLKELLDLNFQGVRAELKADRDIFTLKLDNIIEHNERQNGWIQDHTESIEKLEDHARACKSQRRTVRSISKKWWLALIAMVIISIGTTWSYHHLKIDKVKIGPVEFEMEPVRGGEVN